MKEYLKVGQIINTHGINGEVKVFPLTDDVRRYSKLKYVYMKSEEVYEKINIESVKYIKNFAVLKLSGIDNMNAAEKLKNTYIYVDRKNAIKLPEDSYFIADLIGIEVFTTEEEILGKITSVFSTGSNDVYEIKMDDGKVIFVPAIKDVVQSVDIHENRMVIKLLEGLL